MNRTALLFVLLAGLALGRPETPERVITIDPGHGGAESSGRIEDRTLSSANNAKTPSGILEKTLTLELSKQIAHALESLGKENHLRVKVRLTREADHNPDFAERARRCLGDGNPPAAIVSVHFNASASHAARGSVGMVAAPDHNVHFERDKALASRLTQAVSRGVAAFVPGSKARAPITDSHLHGGRGSHFFHQLQKIPELREVPACFLEVEFIDRTDIEEQLIRRRAESFPKIAREVAKELLALAEEGTR